MIDVSIIIPVYNAGELIRRCLDSVIAQRGENIYEVILVDDGSTDNSVEIIKSYNNNAFKLHYQQNAGPSNARNRGIDIANGKYITFLDADDYWEETFVQETLEFMEKHNDCVAVSCVSKNITKTHPKGSFRPNIFNKNKALFDENGMLVSCPFVVRNFFRYWGEYRHVGTCSTTMRTQEVKNIKFREDLRVTEDYEFWFALATNGSWGIIPKPLYVSDGCSLVDNSKEWLAKMQVRWKNAPFIKDWQKRIIEFKPELANNKDFVFACSKVSRDLVYCQMLSSRFEESRMEALKYGVMYPKDSISQLMNISKHYRVLWWMLAKFLLYRETHRK